MFQRVGVVGCGLMGSGIAQVCGQAELDVIVVEANPHVAEAGRARLAASLAKAQERGKVESAQAVLDRIEVTADIERLHDREIVIEAIAEMAAAKTALFKRLDELVEAPDAILASNTSSIPISTIAAATKRPEFVMGVHFFNPVPVLTLVELVPSLLTSPETVERARAFAADQLGKHPITAPDRSGFVVNALLVPFVLSAIRMLESGVATAEDIDEGLVRGAAHPQGPLALADLIGLDTMVSIAESLYDEFKEPTYAAPPLLRRMVEAGLLGRKSGRGFYTY